MKTILILGATSRLGRELSKVFSRENRVILSGRNLKSLEDVATKCVESEIYSTSIVAADLSISIEPIMNANSIRPIDLIIDASSAATGARDSATSTYNISAIIQADLVSHIEISQALTKANGKHPDIVFISSILTTVKTADREIYSSIKRLREILLEKFFQENGNCSILIIRLGKFRNFYAMAKKIEHLIAQSQNSRQFKIKQMGVDSLILYTLNLIHPVLATVCAKISRAMTENRTL